MVRRLFVVEPAMAVDEMTSRATDAAAFLKALAHEGRLMILCHLVSGEKTVTALEDLLGARQAAVSQQLARLRIESIKAIRSADVDQKLADLGASPVGDSSDTFGAFLRNELDKWKSVAKAGNITAQ